MSTPIAGNIGQELNLLIKQGSDFAIEIDLQEENGDPFNTDDFSAIAAMRKQPFREPIVSFECSFVFSGRLRIAMSASDTANLACGAELYDDESSYSWDCELIDNANALTIPGFFGDVNVFRNI